jgi:hypothetical protein
LRLSSTHHRNKQVDLALLSIGNSKKKEQANKQIKNGKISEGVREVG